MRKNLFYRRTLQAFGALLLVTSLCCGNASAATDAEPCAASLETRQLGYWLGNWATGSGADRATSKVFFSLDKCVFVEHWENAKGHVTEKTFAYSPEEKNWYGIFIDNQGRAHVFLDGKVSSEKAEFHGPSRGPKGETVLNRLQVIHVPPDNMQEIWEKSNDNGITWTTAYRVQYSRANQ